MQLLGHVTLPLADPVAFACIHPFRHQFQIGDHIVQLGRNGTQDYVAD